MQSEERLELVRTLTRSAMELRDPVAAADFDDDFAVWALNAGAGLVAENAPPLAPVAHGLDTTLVAGMFFQVLMEASRLPVNRPERVTFVRKKAKDYLVTRLAGQITMAQFYRLLNIIEENVGYYFEHLQDDWTGVRVTAARPAAAAAPPPTAQIKGEELRQALDRLALPEKGRGKFTAESLWEFLNGNGGEWFRLLDLEAHFQVNKKTAWTYLNLLLTAGVLEHNGEKANRARYALASRFRSGDKGSTVAA
jgi:hypothetical protein